MMEIPLKNLNNALFNIDSIAQEEYKNYQNEKNIPDNPFSFALALEVEGLFIIPSKYNIDFDYGNSSDGILIDANPEDSVETFKQDLIVAIEKLIKKKEAL